MNLMEESFQNKEENKKSKATTIILIAIILLVIMIIGIAGYIVFLQNNQLRLYLDGQENSKVLQILKFESDGTIYVPIKEVANYLGYESFNGEYSDKSEEKSKCYVQSENEVANFTLGSDKIYKMDLSKGNSKYEYVYMKNPVKAIEGVLYISTDGLEKAFNVSFEYDQSKNRISIYTMSYLINFYSAKILDLGYKEISPVFTNQKTVLQNMLIVSKENSKYAVIDIQGNVILEPKYDNITYLPDTSDFLVESNKKVGIVSKEKATKVQIIYDSIELMDSDAGLYIAKKDNKYGVIDINGNIKIHIENDEIGIDASKFAENNIKNNYLLADSLIPIKKDGYWSLYNKEGRKITEVEYDSFGYVASNNKNALNLLVIPDYNVLVACKDKKYTILNSSGEQLIGIIADDIYMTISGGEKHYYILANNKTYDAEAYLDSQGIPTKNSNRSSNENEEDEEINTENNDDSINENETTTNSNESSDNNE